MSNRENRVGRGVVEVAAVVRLEVVLDVVERVEEGEEEGGGLMVESCHRSSCWTGL